MLCAAPKYQSYVHFSTSEGSLVAGQFSRPNRATRVSQAVSNLTLDLFQQSSSSPPLHPPRRTLPQSDPDHTFSED
ncbi:unnamed protein product [Plutella xylostella]|uniref:(diamondback moth) hypothetical protein n=1 Tax=Plutella xylostella TaxID=51655 RepID=A0A8S4EHE6_PLUXY|nr:unnamed protein product [Plutella xylostella]